MQEPSNTLLETHSSQSLRNVESMLSCSLDEAFALVEKCPHQRLWGMLGNTALQKRQFQLAIKSFVRMNDYKTIQYIKQVGSEIATSCTLALKRERGHTFTNVSRCVPLTTRPTLSLCVCGECMCTHILAHECEDQLLAGEATHLRAD